MNTSSKPETIDGEFRASEAPPVSAPPPPPSKGSWTGAGLVFIISAIVLSVTVTRFWMHWYADPQETVPTTSVAKGAPVSIAALPNARIAVLDVGALTVAWGMSTGSDPNAVAEKLKQVLRQLAEAGVVVVEPRYALAFPTNSDITAQVADRVGIDLKALSATPTSNYNNPATPTVVEGTGWKNALPGGARDTTTSPMPRSVPAKGKSPTVQEDANLD